MVDYESETAVNTRIQRQEGVHEVSQGLLTRTVISVDLADWA
jgi:hypothetical protein